VDAAYQNALQRRARLLRDLEKVEQFLALYEEFAADGPQNASGATPEQTANIKEIRPQEFVVVGEQSALPLMQDESRKRTQGNPKPADVIRTVKELLAEKGHPMTRRQLLDALKSRDVVIRGANPMKVLGTNLWRSDDVVSLEGHGYWLADQQYHPAGYYPGLVEVHRAAP
jgi:hypothetical protein